MKKFLSTCILACMLTAIMPFQSVQALQESKPSSLLNGGISTYVIDPGYDLDWQYLDANKSIAWKPNGGSVKIDNIITHKIVYLSRLEAIAVAEGYRDSALKNELVKVLDIAQRTASYSGGYLTGKAAYDIAKKAGLSRAKKFFAGIGGTILIGFLVDDFLNMLRYLDYNSFKDAIDQTNEDGHIRIEIGTSYNGYGFRTYDAWNHKIVQGLPNVNGYWTTDISF